MTTILTPHALTPHATRATYRRDQRGQVGSKPSPVGDCLPPTAGLRKTERDPISTSGPTISLCHRSGQFLRTNQSVSPRSPLPDR